MDERIGILYLDDEEQNLMSFKALFRREFDVYTTNSAQEAVNILNNHPIHIIFSDQKMPDVSGVEFFETILHDFPHAVRILLTGYADIEAVIDAINKGQVYRYVTKPWDQNDLRMCMENALEKYKRDQEILEKNKALERANAELEKFVYSASHDLRAPVVSIKGVINVARMEGMDAKSAEYFNMIERSTDKLNDFVNNIINYYQNNQFDELQEDIKFEHFIDEAIQRYKHYDGAEQVVLKKEISQSAPFLTDGNRLRMIMNNLISNAIKFRDPQKAVSWVDISVVQNKEKALIKIADNGVGVSPEKLPHLFEMFFSDAERNIGSGIGLYIARQAALKLHGTLSVTSQLGEGTRFTLEIPNKA